MNAVFNGIKPGWNLERVRGLEAAITRAYSLDSATCPEDPSLVLEVFRWLSPGEVRVICLGQDPYPRRRDARGLAFVAPSKTHSGDSIFSNLQSFGYIAKEQIPEVAEFRGYLPQGVLLINSSLTVAEGCPNSHREIWEGLVAEILSVVPSRSVALRLGEVAASVPLPCVVSIYSTHPVIPSAEEFQKIDCFGAVNARLEDLGMEKIDWAACRIDPARIPKSSRS